MSHPEYFGLQKFIEIAQKATKDCQSASKVNEIFNAKLKEYKDKQLKQIEVFTMFKSQLNFVEVYHEKAL